MLLPGKKGGGAVCEHVVRTTVIALLCFAAAVAFCSGFCAEPVESRIFDQIIYSAAGKYGVDPLLIKAMVWRESSFLPLSTGSSGEIGLMQIKMVTVQDWADAHKVPLPEKNDVYDPELNIEIGVWYIARAMKQWKDHPRRIFLALCQYNAGRRGLFRLLKENGQDLEKLQSATAVGSYARSIYWKYLDYRSQKVDMQFARITAVSVPR